MAGACWSFIELHLMEPDKARALAGKLERTEFLSGGVERRSVLDRMLALALCSYEPATGVVELPWPDGSRSAWRWDEAEGFWSMWRVFVEGA